jgi:AcrR family transcriptional regulator
MELTSDNRLSKQDWIDAGLRALAVSGVGALKADTLAKVLGVSRGSFYWHFTNVSDFHVAVLSAWEKRSTDDVIALVEKESGEPIAKLHHLARHVFSADGALERQIRAWASQEQHAATFQDRVDRRRIGYVQALIENSGQSRDNATMRAHFVYLALIGQFSAGRSFALGRKELDDMVKLILQTD